LELAKKHKGMKNKKKEATQSGHPNSDPYFDTTDVLLWKQVLYLVHKHALENKVEWQVQNLLGNWTAIPQAMLEVCLKINKTSEKKSFDELWKITSAHWFNNSISEWIDEEVLNEVINEVCGTLLKIDYCLV